MGTKGYLDETQQGVLRDLGIKGIPAPGMEFVGISTMLDILPKVLHKEGLAYHYNLSMYWDEDVKVWRATYDAIGDNLGSESAPELIDALYKLAIKTLSNATEV